MSCISAEDIDLIIPSHGIAGTSFDIQTRQQAPDILLEVINLTVRKYGHVIFAKISATENIQLFVIEQRGMGVPSLIHVGDFSDCMGVTVVDETAIRNIVEAEIHPSRNKILLMSQIQHGTEVARLEPLRN